MPSSGSAHHTQVKSKLPAVAIRPREISPPQPMSSDSSPTSSLYSLSYSQRAFFQLLRQVKFFLTTGPLHLLFPYLFFFLPHVDTAGSLSSFKGQQKYHFLRKPSLIAPFKALLWHVLSMFNFFQGSCHLFTHCFSYLLPLPPG